MIHFDTTNWRVEKILTLADAEQKAADFKKEDKKLVTVNGSFDLMHAGHLDQLEEAKKQGDMLFVGINSDASVKEAKGEDRPLISEQARAAMLAALECVDFVVVVDAAYDEVQNVLLRTVKPDIHVNGPDYGEPETWIEWPTMQEVGAVGYVVQKRNNLATSDIVAKIRS